MFSIDKWSIYKNISIRFLCGNVFLPIVITLSVDNLMMASDSIEKNYIYLTIWPSKSIKNYAN